MSEIVNHIGKARQCLAYGHKNLESDIAFDAGRNAYLAAYHAALAYVLHKTGKAPKSHSGVRAEFGRLAKDDSRIDRACTTFLAQAYNLKTVADYGVALDDVLSVAEAQTALDMAASFIRIVVSALDADGLTS